MTKFFSVHARERAMERYGIDLSVLDFAVMLRECQEGKALQQRSNGDSRTFLVWHRSTRFVMVTDAACQFLITFNPPEACLAGAARKQARKAGKVHKARQMAGRRPEPEETEE